MDTITPSEIQRALNMQSAFTVLSAVLATTATVVAIWRGVRREPPVDKDLEEIRAELLKRPTHTDCTGKHLRIADEARRLNDAGQKSVDDELQHTRDVLDQGAKQFLQIERTLGRIEAKQEATSVRLSEIQAELIALKKDLQ
jgi:hypothetical protein